MSPSLLEQFRGAVGSAKWEQLTPEDRDLSERLIACLEAGEEWPNVSLTGLEKRRLFMVDLL